MVQFLITVLLLPFYCNSNSQAVGEGAFNLDGATISVAEAMCLREGLWFAKRKGFQKVYVEGDSKLII